MTHVLLLDHRVTPDMLGLIPHFLDAGDARPAHEQLDANYQHGGGWRPMPGFKLGHQMTLRYPGDPALQPLAVMRLRQEEIYMYPHGFVAIVQPDGSFEAARMD